MRRTMIGAAIALLTITGAAKAGEQEISVAMTCYRDTGCTLMLRFKTPEECKQYADYINQAHPEWTNREKDPSVKCFKTTVHVQEYEEEK